MLINIDVAVLLISYKIEYFSLIPSVANAAEPPKTVQAHARLPSHSLLVFFLLRPLRREPLMVLSALATTLPCASRECSVDLRVHARFVS